MAMASAAPAANAAAHHGARLPTTTIASTPATITTASIAGVPVGAAELRAATSAAITPIAATIRPVARPARRAGALTGCPGARATSTLLTLRSLQSVIRRRPGDAAAW